MPQNAIRRERRIVATFGDRDPITYGGGVVFAGYTDEQGRYNNPEFEYTHGLEDEHPLDTRSGETTEDDPKRELTVYRGQIEPDAVKDLNWAEPSEIASSIDMDVDELIALGRSKKVADRMYYYEAVAGHWGWHELDSYPEKFTVTKLEKRWKL